MGHGKRRSFFCTINLSVNIQCWNIFTKGVFIFYHLTHFCSLKLSVLFLHNSRKKRSVNHCKRMLFSLTYCWIVTSFLSWSSRTTSLLSKVSIVLWFNRFLFCILLFLFGLNKLSKKYIWKIPQVTELRS